jgi:hypothetical protein
MKQDAYTYFAAAGLTLHLLLLLRQHVLAESVAGSFATSETQRRAAAEPYNLHVCGT